MAKPGRLGWMKALLLSLLVLGAAGYGLWRYALANNAVALLDWIDAGFAGTDGARLAREAVSYGTDPAQTLDIWTPEQPGTRRPVLVFIYGGGWRSGSPGEYRFIGRHYARKGYVVAVLGYRLTPDGQFPAMLEDSAKGIAWVRDHIAEHGGDPAQVIAMGHSAGAYNAVMLALDPRWLAREGVPADYLKGVVALAGPYDFYPFTSASTRAAFGGAADPAATQPVRFARAGVPPLLLASGDADTTVRPRNSMTLAKALSAAGSPTQTVLFKGMGHAGILMTLAAPWNRDRRVGDAIDAFLAERRAASAPVQRVAG
jgi:acetyl esterase/lipase